LGVLPDDLYIEPEPWPRIGRPPKHDVEAWTVTDDWPDPVPITDAELDVFEAPTIALSHCRLRENRRKVSVASSGRDACRQFCDQYARARARHGVLGR
jgi:hypothetical protein